MTRRRATGWAYIVALVATIAAFWQVIIWYDRRIISEALWLPSVTLLDVNGESMVLLGLVQFPALATGFAIGIRRWSIRTVLATVVITYAAAVGAALAINFPQVKW